MMTAITPDRFIGNGEWFGIMKSPVPCIVPASSGRMTMVMTDPIMGRAIMAAGRYPPTSA